MRVAALYDIHGNAPALEAVLADVPDDAAVVVGGDIAIGPQPLETLELLTALGGRARWIRGNCERRDPHGDGVWEQRRVWTEERLGDERADALAALPETVAFELEGLGPTLFCHGSPRSDEEILTAVTSDERLRTILAGVGERVVVCGHTHHQFDRLVGEFRVVNAGSVGMPYEARPGAYWALLGPDVELRRSEYDIVAAEAAIRASTYPGPDEQIETLFVAQPSAQEAAEHFERQALEQEAQ
jgi:predicted phosphodiesterase